MKRGVRQGGKVSPFLFNVYSERIIPKSLEEWTIGIKVNGINNVRYGDDSILIAEILDLHLVMDVTEESGLTLKVKETKFMTIAKTQQYTLNIRVVHIEKSSNTDILVRLVVMITIIRRK